MAGTPVAVEMWRGQRVESRHRVRVCVADTDGRVLLALGDIDQPVYPRSAVKPFRALDETALACGPHAPLHQPSAAALLRAGAAPGRVHNNCSGKHAGMLAAARQLDAPKLGYELPQHEVLALLAHVGALGDAPPESLRRFQAPRLRNGAGGVVGHVRVVAGWPGH